jgi:hypothetical protein
MTWKSTAIVTGATALVGWLASPLPQAPAQSVAIGQPQTAERPASSSDIEQQADRLRARLRAEAIFRAPSRDPFRFGERRIQVEPRAIAPPPEAIEAPAIPQPLVTLSGIATDLIDGVTRRTGILSSPEGVLLVREGDTVSGIYRVEKIEEETLDLVRPGDGGLLRLRLATPRP